MYSLSIPLSPDLSNISLILFFFECSCDHRDLHSFPTRRSSDLFGRVVGRRPIVGVRQGSPGGRGWTRTGRSEEHTSELQSQSNLVCRLLLEKKKVSNVL